MRLDKYFELEIGRLPSRFGAEREAGGDAAALVYLQKQLTLMEQVLDGDPCPPLDAPVSVGDPRWNALVSAALLVTLGPAWPEPAPLPTPWFPTAETSEARAEAERETPGPLFRANVFIRRSDLRWRPASTPLP